MPGFSDFEFEQGNAGRSGPWSFIGLPRSVAWARGMKGEHVTVRVNPLLAVEIDSAASAVRVSGCEGGVKIRVVAASVKLERIRGALTVEALTSSVKGSAAVTGESRIAGESSSVKLSLLPGSNVRARMVSNRLGKVVLPGAPAAGTVPQPESVVGQGEGSLLVEGSMSSITITTDPATPRATA